MRCLNDMRSQIQMQPRLQSSARASRVPAWAIAATASTALSPRPAVQSLPAADTAAAGVGASVKAQPQVQPKFQLHRPFHIQTQHQQAPKQVVVQDPQQWQQQQQQQPLQQGSPYQQLIDAEQQERHWQQLQPVGFISDMQQQPADSHPGHPSSHSRSSIASSRTQQQSQQQYGLHQTLHVLRSSSSSAAEAAKASPQLLTSAITQCETLTDVLQVFWECSAAFNNVHVAAMVTRLPKILRCSQQQQQHNSQYHHQLHQQHYHHQQQQQQQQQQHAGSGLSLSHSEQQDLQQLLTDLSQLSEELLPNCSPREMSNIAWGFAALGFYSRRLLQLLLGRCSLPALKPQELSNLAWAVAKQGHEVPAAWVDELLLLSGRVLQAGGFKPQEAANLAWSLAVMQRQCLLVSTPPSRVQGSSLYSSCVRVDEAWKQGFCRAAEAQLGLWGAADISQGLWALAVLGFSDIQQQWLDRVLVRGLQLLGQGHMESRHAGSMMWSVAKLQQQLQQQQCAAVAAAADGATQCDSRSSGSAVSPTVAVFAAAVSSKLPLLLQGEQQPLHLAAVVLHAYQQLQLQPPAAAVDALLAAAARQLGKLDLAAAAAHAAALPDQPAGKQQQRKQRQKHLWQRLQQQQQQRPELLLDISMLLHSLAKLSYRPTQQFMGAIAAVVEDRAWHVVDCHDGLNALAEAWQSLQQQQQQQQQGLSSSQAGQHHQQQQLGGSASVTAATASKQQQILLQRQQLLQELQSSMRGREVSPLLWAMGKLRYQAPKSMLRPVKMACWRQRAHCSAADVSVIFWALARMRHRPGYVWVRFMLEHFLIRIDDRVGGAADVCNVVHALPNLGGVNQCHPLREKLGMGALQGLADAAAVRFSECGPREVRQLAVGFARLGYKPAGIWVEQHMQRVQQLGRGAFSKREWRALQQAYELLPVAEGAERVAVAVQS